MLQQNFVHKRRVGIRVRHRRWGQQVGHVGMVLSRLGFEKTAGRLELRGGRQRAGCSDGDMPRIVLPWLAFGRVHVVGGGLPTGSRSVFLSKSGLATQNTLAAKSFLALLPLESNEPFGRADTSGFTWV